MSPSLFTISTTLSHPNDALPNPFCPYISKLLLMPTITNSGKPSRRPTNAITKARQQLEQEMTQHAELEGELVLFVSFNSYLTLTSRGSSHTSLNSRYSGGMCKGS